MEEYTGFPLWLRVNHYINFLLMIMLIRSGIQILADFPRLYWNLHCTPGSEWIKFTRKVPAVDRIWTSLDEAVNVSPWVAMPGGRHNLGIGRHWHFLSVIFWIANGLTYVTLLFATGYWQRLIPTSWDIVPRAVDTFVHYASFQLPPAADFRPYDPLQQLAYAFVVFVLAPLAILTGAAMSPAVVAHWPWYQRLFGNRQIARSIHFLVMAAYLGFLCVHVALVVLTGFSKNMNHIVFGATSGESQEAVALGLGFIAFAILLHVFLTLYSRKQPLNIQHWTGAITDRAMLLLFNRLTSRQEYRESDISPYFWTNGPPPETDEYRALVDDGFSLWRLQVKGLVETPLSLSLADLRAMRRQDQTTMHNCIQGWSGIAKWSGVRLTDVLKACGPLPDAKFVIFHSYMIDAEGREYYGSLDMESAHHAQTLLAYEMNGEPLPLQHGAPLRLRVETKLGFKMVKYLQSIELTHDYKHIGAGQGGYREDTQFFGTVAGI